MAFPDGTIDLRSDTVTLPTPEMRAAMAAAELGDDVYREDPTVRRLEERAAELTGHAAALLVASGRMANLVAVLSHAAPGDEVLVGERSHIMEDEASSMARLGGFLVTGVPNRVDGTVALDELARRLRSDADVVTRVVCLENTHGDCGGAPLEEAYTRDVVALARARGAKVHVDGARLLNAAAALGLAPSRLAAPVDSVGICLSKGLCAPIGSVLCGSADFIEVARMWRRRLGGGMRQAGVIAAAGLVALETPPSRLHEDHAHATMLADGLRGIRGLTVEAPRTNLVFFELTAAAALDGPGMMSALWSRRIKIDVDHPTQFRLATHRWVSADDVRRVLTVLRAALGVRPGPPYDVSSTLG